MLLEADTPSVIHITSLTQEDLMSGTWDKGEDTIRHGYSKPIQFESTAQSKWYFRILSSHNVYEKNKTWWYFTFLVINYSDNKVHATFRGDRGFVIAETEFEAIWKLYDKMQMLPLDWL